MPLFYFDSHDGTRFLKDEDGLECASLEIVRKRTIDALPDIARDELPDGDDHVMWVKVRDASGRYLFEASLTLSAKWL